MRALFITFAAGLVLTACGNSITVTVTNNSDTARHDEIVGLPADSVLGRLGSRYCNVLDADGNTLVSQVTHDRQLIFRASVSPGGKAEYTIIPSDTLPVFAPYATGRVYPERADDIAWENQIVGFRMYGPETQARGEKAYGYDIFFKHPTDRQVLEELYAAQTSKELWRKADSLRAIDRSLADDFVKTFTYHIDHGLGMDCYAVGPTLGAGTAAIGQGDTIHYPWCYERAEILDNGPLRFSMRVDFAPVTIGSDSAVTEHRIISLDAGSHLNRCMVWYDGLSGRQYDIVAGFPRRDNSVAVTDTVNGILAYADPTLGPDNGKALLGIILGTGVTGMTETDGHILVRTRIAPADTVTYHWGFAWDRTDITSMDGWNEYLLRYDAMTDTPPVVTWH